MTIYITVSYRDHRMKPVYAKVTSSPLRIRQIINFAVNRCNGRCYHSRGKYLKLFISSDYPEELMYLLKTLQGEVIKKNAEIPNSYLAKL